jgi:cell division protein FtsB
LEKLRDDLRELEKRVAKLEGGEELLIERARSSAAVAASGAVTHIWWKCRAG